MQSVKEVATQITMGLVTDREKAIALHNYIRDNVKFGFTKRFDAADPSYTLSCGIGHCNPKSRLMVSLFREAGLESHQHFVIIPSDILKDAFPPSRRWLLPAQLSHGFVEVNVEGTWCAIDSYSIDTALLKGAEAALSKHGRSVSRHWAAQQLDGADPVSCGESGPVLVSKSWPGASSRGR
jgi:transglutaminase-like putative cysteine protease